MSEPDGTQNNAGFDAKRDVNVDAQNVAGHDIHIHYHSGKEPVDYSASSVGTQPLPPPSPNLRMRDHLFIAYSHSERLWVERLAGDLRNKGHITWIDFEGIRGDDVWRQSIVDGISASAVVLVVLSSESVQSEWLKMEVQTARKYGKNIVPLLLHPEVSNADCQALGIGEIQYRDFTGDYAHAFGALLEDLPKPASGIPGHCQKLAARLATASWGLDHYIDEEARLLPIDASPYEGGVVKSPAENLMKRLWASHHTIVLGEPGMGKTVALERLAWELARNEPPIVPVIVRLLEYDGRPLLEWVRLSLVSTGEIELDTVDETRHFLKSAPFDCYYFLLDGLNEVRPAYRDQLEGEIIRLALEWGRHRLVVTSRVQDESWRFLQRGSAFQETFLIQNIRREQAQTYLVAHLGKPDGSILWEKLDPLMRGLVTTPLLLWFVKETWRKARESCSPESIRVPENRGELYRDFIEMMLYRDEARRRFPNVSKSQRLRTLEHVALAMHENQSVEISREDALRLVDSEEVLKALLDNELLIGDQRLRFVPHQTVQEHFAACALQEEMARLAKAGKQLPHADDSWWAETFIQLAGLTDDPNILARAIAETNPWLALWCVREGRKVDKATEKAIEARSIALVNSKRVQDRRSAAQALRRLQKTPRVLEPLSILATDEDEETGQVALEAIKVFGEAASRRLVVQLNNPEVKPPARLRIGLALAEMGDPRPGVSLDTDGLPDIDWVEVPAGEFIYQDGERLYLEAFEIARYPVTYVQFQAFINDPEGFTNSKWWEGLMERPNAPNEQYWKSANHPRENVSWCEAVAFCRWLSTKLSHEVRLPTEQEWEKAARGTDGRKYPWGDDYISGYANVNETWENVGQYNLGRATAVGVYLQSASPYGVLDMSGNVYEWCLNEYDNPTSIKLTGTSKRVMRGGSWFYKCLSACTTFRFKYSSSYFYGGRGFRCVRPHSS